MALLRSRNNFKVFSKFVLALAQLSFASTLALLMLVMLLHHCAGVNFGERSKNLNHGFLWGLQSITGCISGRKVGCLKPLSH
jgi:hypothetical protein